MAAPPAWVKTIYQNPKLRTALMNSYGEVFSRYAADVWVAEGGLGQPPQDFVNGMVEGYVDHHLDSSRAQLEEMFTRITELPADQQGKATRDRLREWLQKRPEKVSANETVRAANAIAVERMRTDGVTRKVWRTSGSDVCPYCKSLNGKTIAVEDAFFTPEDSFKPQGAKQPLTFRSNIKHPPVHQGCDCGIAAVLEIETVEAPPTPSTVPANARIGESERASVDWAKDLWGTKTGPFYKSLSKAEMDAVSRYSGSDFRRVNGFLRGKYKGSTALNNRIQSLDSAIGRSAVNKDVTVVRGTTLSAFQRYHPKNFIGKEITEPGFMSTSVKPLSGFRFDHGVRLNITAPKGTNAIYLEPVTSVKGEQEILFGRGTRMRVDNVVEKKIGKRTEYWVDVTIVGP